MAFKQIDDHDHPAHCVVLDSNINRIHQVYIQCLDTFLQTDALLGKRPGPEGPVKKWLSSNRLMIEGCTHRLLELYPAQ